MMTDEEFDVNGWHRASWALVQALLGAVSENFRRVLLALDEDQWVLEFILERESAEDVEEIEDVATEFEALFDGPVNFRVEIQVNAEPIAWPKPPARVVFRRRES